MPSSAPSPRDHGTQLVPAAHARRTWMDVTGTILGHPGRLSPLGASVLRRALDHFNRVALRVDRPATDPRNLVGVFDGRAWLNLSALHGYLSVQSISRWVGEVDPFLAGRLESADLSASDDLREAALLPGLMMQGARTLAAAVAGQLQPVRSAAQARAEWAAWRATIDRRAARPLDHRGLLARVDHLLAPTAALVVHELMPRIALATTAARALREPFAHRTDCQPLLDALDRGITGHRVTDFLQAAAEGPDHRLLDRFGHRALRALDVVEPRFADAPDTLVEFCAPLPPADHLSAACTRARQARKLAVATLASELTRPLDRARFLAAAEVVESLSGLSDWPLDALLVCLHAIRPTLVAIARDAEAAGRLDPGTWRSLDLAGLDALHRGHTPAHTSAVPLPGRSVHPPGPARSAGLVSGVASGVLAIPGAPHQPDNPVWVLDALTFAHAPLITSSAAAVVTTSHGHGPAALVAATLGRPCVYVPADRLPAPGTRVTVDGSRGTVTADPSPTDAR